jgi:phosphoglycerate dehydrogenase-like enzyme
MSGRERSRSRSPSRRGGGPGSAARPIVFVAGGPTASPVHAITPERLAAAARRHAVFARVRIVQSGAVEDLARAEILLGTGVEPRTLPTVAPKLRWIQALSAGVERFAPLLDRKYVLANVSGVHGPKGGEYALTCLLALNHGLQRFVTNQRRHAWEPFFTTPIVGKTVVILGAGALGRAVAREARRHGLRVVGVNTTGRRVAGFHEVVKTMSLPRVLPRADFLVITLPKTPATIGLLDRAAVQRLPDHCGVVNIGRGAVIDTDALAARLRAGTLAGAVLDVFEPEPLPADSPLWDVPNLIVSPHCGIDDASAYVDRGLDVFAANLERYLAGRRLLNVVDLGRGY